MSSSVLGPIINDLPALISNLFKLYADGSKILAVAYDPEDQDLSEGLRSQVQNDQNNTTNWTKNWLVKLNETKCK